MMMTTTMMMTVTWKGRASKVQHLPSAFVSLFFFIFGLKLISALNLTLMKSANKDLLLTVDNHGDV